MDKGRRWLVSLTILASFLLGMVVSLRYTGVKARKVEENIKNVAGTAEQVAAVATPEYKTQVPLAGVDEESTVSKRKDTMKKENVEAELLEIRYYRDDIPLPYELQDCLHLACQEANIPYALALAVIEHETHFRNVIGDDGASEGYMQVQRKWHYDRMERLGVTDLSDPFGNFRVGCDFLSELLDTYPMQEALTAYNSGGPGYNEYSYEVMDSYEKWKELVGDDISGIKG